MRHVLLRYAGVLLAAGALAGCKISLPIGKVAATESAEPWSHENPAQSPQHSSPNATDLPGEPVAFADYRDVSPTQHSVQTASFGVVAAIAQDHSGRAVEPQRTQGHTTPPEVISAPDSDGTDLPDRPTLPLDLPTALGLAQGQNPRVAFAQAQVSQAYAQFEAARVMWLPSLRAGMNYNKHEGRIQDVVGDAIETSRGAAFGGFGANAVGAGSPAIPGVYVQFHAADAIYQPRIAEYALDSREYQSTALTNDQLLETALAYVSLLESAQRKAIAQETLVNGESLAKLTSEFARTGAGNLADADRAATALSSLRNELLRAEEAQTVASARLAQQLSADPQIEITPQETSVIPINLVSIQETELSDLVATGLANRPELAANSALVCAAVNRLRREERAPWLPSVLLGVSYGAFGAGTGGAITNGGDRFDFDGAAWWEIRNLGFGERAARDNARAQIQQARMQEIAAMDLVAREIVEAHAQVQARQKQIAFAEQGIASAQQSHKRNLERIQNAQGLPIEVLQSIQALDAARRDYLRVVVDYNTAQFRLQRALGWPVSM